MTSMVLILLGLTLLAAILDWIALARGNKPLEFVVKPAVMILLMITVQVWVRPFQFPVRMGVLDWFVAALFFSLLGDVFLMLPEEKLIPGMVAFMLGHVAYIFGFKPWPVGEGELLPALILGVVSLAIGLVSYQYLAGGLDKSGRTGLKGPVLVYALVICGMLFSAAFMIFQGEWELFPAVLGTLGAISFTISDIRHGILKFVGPVKGGRALVHAFYHVGQTLIVIGAALHFV